MILETNLRIVAPGSALAVPVRLATVEAVPLTDDSVERACSFLQSRHQLASKPTGKLAGELFVLSKERLEAIRLEDDNSVLTVKDSGEDGLFLHLTDDLGQRKLPALLERALLIQVAKRTNLWRLDSPRKWFEPSPFMSADGIDAYRRFEISALAVESIGTAVSVDISTAFFTRHTLAAFCDPNLTHKEVKEKQVMFDRLTGRQQGQKGTLAYDNGRARTVCYFKKWDPDRTCGTTPEFRIDGTTYNSLHHYYAERFPHLKVGPDEPAVLVSFRGIDKPVWAGARLLRVRVMNDSLPDSLGSVDKIAPLERSRMIEQFWSTLGPYPFGELFLDLMPGFWRPAPDRVLLIPMPSLEFGKARTLRRPTNATPSDYRSHFRQRGELLEKAGCYCSWCRSASKPGCRFSDDTV